VQKIVATGTYENYSEEWKICRETIDRFDGILVDLRKYGFSILTGLTTAGSFLDSLPQQQIYKLESSLLSWL